MPNPNNRGVRDFSGYDEMSDEQLREILRKDASNLEGEDTDMELMLHIMEVLAKRRKEANEDISPEKALEEFKEKYTYTDNSLISEERPTKRKTIGFGRWQRWVATVAALLILVFGSSLTAQAFGFDLWEIIVQWTKETFHFSNSSNISDDINPEKEDSSTYIELNKVLGDYHVSANLVPSYLPEGYIEVDVKVNESPAQRVFTAKYERGEEQIRIRISDYLNAFPLQIEQSDELVEKYVSGDIEYFIFNNYDQLRAVWICEQYECYIMGDLSLTEMKEIIDSIEKG